MGHAQCDIEGRISVDEGTRGGDDKAVVIRVENIWDFSWCKPKLVRVNGNGYEASEQPVIKWTWLVADEGGNNDAKNACFKCENVSYRLKGLNFLSPSYLSSEICKIII